MHDEAPVAVSRIECEFSEVGGSTGLILFKTACLERIGDGPVLAGRLHGRSADDSD